MLDWLATNWPFVLLALIPIPITIYLTLKLQPRKRPRYAYVTQVLQTKTHPSVTILYSGSPVDSLHVLRLGFWNAGPVELRDTDIPREGGPAIQFSENVSVFSAMTDESAPQTKADTDFLQQGNLLPIRFEYLNKGDGLKVEVLFATEGEVAEPFAVTGSIKGAKITGARWSREAPGEMLVLLGFPLVLLVASVFFAFLGYSGGRNARDLAFSVITAATALFFLRVSWPTLRPTLTRVPAWLRDFLGQS